MSLVPPARMLAAALFASGDISQPSGWISNRHFGFICLIPLNSERMARYKCERSRSVASQTALSFAMETDGLWGNKPLHPSTQMQRDGGRHRYVDGFRNILKGDWGSVQSEIY